MQLSKTRKYVEQNVFILGLLLMCPFPAVQRGWCLGSLELRELTPSDLLLCLLQMLDA